MLTKSVRSVSTAVCILGTFAASRASAAEPQIFQASEIIKREVLRGPDYSIADTVTLQGGRYGFTIVTPYGRIPAIGLDMLELRLSEMGALNAAEEMTKHSQELAGIKDNIKKTGEGLHALLTDPVETLGSVPKGVGRTLESLTKKSTYQGGESRRELAARLGCDPETRNAALRKRMGQISLRRGLGKGITSVATIGLTGGAALAVQGASVVRTTAEMRDTLRTTPLYRINEAIALDLTRLGATPEASKRFAEHPQFTTLQRLQFMSQWGRLRGIDGLPDLLTLANAVKSEEEALGMIHAIALLAAVQQRSRLSGIVEMSIPAGKLSNGQTVAVAANDYLVSGPVLTQWIAALRVLPSPVLLTAGRISESARQELAAAEIQVVERGDVDQIH